MTSEQKTIQVVCHNDLDGVVSYLVLCWLYGRKLNVLGTTPMKLEQDYEKLVTTKNDWEKIYFLDLDVSKIGDKIDKPNAVVLDHHKTNIYPFKHATVRIYNETSCAKLIYDTFFKHSNKTITNAQKTLIALADDWDSNTHATVLSNELNIIYHAMSNKFNSFVEDYYHGFKPFDKFKQNTIALYKKHLTDYTSKLNPFLGTFDFDDQKNIRCGAIFCDKFVQECCDFLFNQYDVDVAIAVLVDQKRIAVRRNSRTNKIIDVSKFTQRIASGGGHEAAAGGNLTEEFIEFTKMLKPC